MTTTDITPNEIRSWLDRLDEMKREKLHLEQAYTDTRKHAVLPSVWEKLEEVDAEFKPQLDNATAQIASLEEQIKDFMREHGAELPKISGDYYEAKWRPGNRDVTVSGVENASQAAKALVQSVSDVALTELSLYLKEDNLANVENALGTLPKSVERVILSAITRQKDSVTIVPKK